MSLTVACVRTGTRYGPEYVYRLREGVRRHLAAQHRFLCLTDAPDALLGVETEDVSRHGLPGWWAKLALLDVASRSDSRVVFLDLDMVICGSLDPLAALEVEFGVCASFTKAAGNAAWPCRYGSCVMSFAPGFGADGWSRFMADRDSYIMRAGNHGDQMVFEWLYPAASLLQPLLPPGFFVGYRDLTDSMPEGCSVAVFAGKAKPHNCEFQWIRNAWE